MAASARTDFDQISLSSSCEIVDGLAESVRDHPVLDKLPVDTASQGLYPDLTMLSVPKVVFTDMLASYSVSRDMVVQYQYMNYNKEGGYGDRVGLYRLPKTQPHEYLAYVWVIRGDGVAILGRSVLPRRGQEGEYQLQYLQVDNMVVGTSTSFHMVREIMSDSEDCSPTEDCNLVVGTLQSEVGEMENINREMVEEENTEEEKTVQTAKVEELLMLSSKLSSCEAQCGELAEKNLILTREREDMARMLEKEMEERVKLLDEKAELVDRLEVFSKQIKDANRGRNMAVEELRALIQQQDKLMQELTEFREETGNAEAELVIVKQEMARINTRMQEGNDINLEDKIKNLMDNLKTQGKYLEEANKKVEKLEQIISELNYEKEGLKLKQKELETVNKKNMNDSLEKLEKDKQELVSRLDNVPIKTIRNVSAFNNENYAKSSEGTQDSGRILSVEEQAKVLNQQLLEATLAISMKETYEKQKQTKLPRNKSQEELRLPQPSSSGKEVVLQDQNPPSSSQKSLSEEKDQFGSCRSNSTDREQPGSSQNFQKGIKAASKSSSLFKTFPPTVPACSSLHVTDPNPSPSAHQVPANVAISYASDIPTISSLECPLCEDKFPGNRNKELERHVELHMKNMMECPICNLMFEKRDQLLFENHVEFHFMSQEQQPQELPLDARGWDLGID